MSTRYLSFQCPLSIVPAQITDCIRKWNSMTLLELKSMRWEGNRREVANPH